MIRKSLAFVFIFAALAIVSTASASSTNDSIQGEWAGVFSIAGHTADVQLKFDVDGSSLTGTVFSEHTGPGTVTDGKWKDGKLTCTLKFEKHESIEFWGTLKDGKLAGEFKTEGTTGTWTATRK